MTKTTVRARSRSTSIEIGPGFPTRVMALFGTGPGHDVRSQEKKLDALSSATSQPDIVSDLSYSYAKSPSPWRRILECTDFVAATLPIYRCSPKNHVVDLNELIDIATEQMESGVGIITIHATPTKELVELSKSRLVPWTSRGGGIVIRDLMAGSASDNVYLKALPALVLTAKRTGTIISLGTTFRSANLFDACDIVHWRELDAQIELANRLTMEGVGAIIEAPGHARPSDIRRLAVPLRSAGFPVMPLGPMPTDAGFDQDHVAAAIGASLMGLEGCAQIIAAVTREEHSGGIPTIDSTLEAVACARLAAHVIDLELLGSDLADRAAAMHRATKRTCVVNKHTPGCSRCSTLCPL
jgi:phosphomethylpyrimidine synthase